jgi:hypothetical protein
MAEAGPNTADAVTSVTADTAPGKVDTAPEGVDGTRNVPTTEALVDLEEVEHQHRALAIARIRLSSAPAALKEQLAGVVETTGNAATVEACLKAVEESLPEFLRENRGDSVRPEHPAGEVFFRGNAEEITDEQAEELAQKQLARSGMLRGQRVKVGD